uniref:Uncharacterized protein n=1 Tax=Glossina palpalis gambiensis TaxID=67801 RepID=A0A1B0BV81_9MUSC
MSFLMYSFVSTGELDIYHIYICIYMYIYIYIYIYIYYNIYKNIITRKLEFFLPPQIFCLEAISKYRYLLASISAISTNLCRIFLLRNEIQWIFCPYLLNIALAIPQLDYWFKSKKINI